VKHVKVTKETPGPHGPLKAGAVVTTTAAEAARLVDAGCADYCGPGGADPAPADAPKDARPAARKGRKGHPDPETPADPQPE
jgi:hypothetical protein